MEQKEKLSCIKQYYIEMNLFSLIFSTFQCRNKTINVKKKKWKSFSPLVICRKWPNKRASLHSINVFISLNMQIHSINPAASVGQRQIGKEQLQNRGTWLWDLQVHFHGFTFGFVGSLVCVCVFYSSSPCPGLLPSVLLPVCASCLLCHPQKWALVL